MALLFRLFNHVLKALSTSIILGLTAVDFLAEILYKGLHLLGGLGEQIFQLLGYTAKWAGIQIKTSSEFSYTIIKSLLDRMLSSLKMSAIQCLAYNTSQMTPVNITTLGAMKLTQIGML